MSWSMMGLFVPNHFFVKCLTFFGIGNKAVFSETLADWHSLEHILYNMLVHVHHVEPQLKKCQVFPELALLNAGGDLISNNIEAIRGLSFVDQKNFHHIRANWYDLLDENLDQFVLARMNALSLADSEFDKESHPLRYRRLFLHNLELIENVTVTRKCPTINSEEPPKQESSGFFDFFSWIRQMWWNTFNWLFGL